MGDYPGTLRSRARGRKREVRAKSIAMKRLRAVALRRLSRCGTDRSLPTTRGECMAAGRPCPYISCKHHLYLDVSPRTGSIKLNFPDLEPWEMPESCALDVADLGGVTLEVVGALLNVTRERIRQLEVKALAKLESSPAAAVLRAMHAESGGAE